MLHNGQVIPRRSLDGVQLHRVSQSWHQPEVTDLPAAVHDALAGAGALERIHPGHSIAITVGSRGIGSMCAILRAIVHQVRARGGEPFLIPAMGSHAGGTAQGQREMLEGLGLGEAKVGAPIRAGMQVQQIGTTPHGFPVVMDQIAAQADGIIVVNRIKKHPNFDGAVESGLCKMAVIGMGKHAQAAAVHQLGNRRMAALLAPMAKVVFESGHVIGGIALIENAIGGLAQVAGLEPQSIVEQEKTLLATAKAMSPRLPFHDVDIAIVERMGKEISGTGMDCYTIGRRRIVGEPEWDDAPFISSLVVLKLTVASHGNAVGVGLADFVPASLVQQIDWPVTYANALTSGNLERVKMPLVCHDDRDAIEAAAFRERKRAVKDIRIACIRDTLHLEELYVSDSLARELEKKPNLEIDRASKMSLPFDRHGGWISPWQDD